MPNVPVTAKPKLRATVYAVAVIHQQKFGSNSNRKLDRSSFAII
jgi:hypothetical protein